jgi:hypothetical protein
MSKRKPRPAANPIVARLDEHIARRGGSRRKISTDAGLDPGFLQKLNDRGPLAGTLTENLTKLAEATGVPAFRRRS